MEHTTAARRQKLVWVLGAIYVGAQIAQPVGDKAIPSDVFNGLVTFSSFGAAVLHGSIRYGWKGIGLFALLTIIISNALENLSVMTSFPFGFYHYSEALGPRILHVPIVIGFAYFSVGYLAWVVANIILDEADLNARALHRFMLPVLAAFVMVGWDVSMDPLQSTVATYWIWRNGGGYFGVPLSNFLGWYFTVFLIYSIFSWVLARRPRWIIAQPSKAYWAQAAVLFLACTIPFFLEYASGSERVVHDARGVAWRVADIGESAVLISLFTMIFAGLAALFIIARRPSVSSPLTAANV